MENDYFDVSNCLEKQSESISDYAPLPPEPPRYDASNVEYLYYDIVGHSWSGSDLTSCYQFTVPSRIDKSSTFLDATWIQELRGVNATL